MFRHFFFAFLVVLLGLLWYRHKLIYFNKTIAIFGIIAPISYGLYIFHFPILEQWNLTPYIPNLFIQYIIKFVTLFGLAYLVEIKLQPLVNQWIK
jgi:peptidoglycan/LPS O-acetylase OafA/YrhL